MNILKPLAFSAGLLFALTSCIGTKDLTDPIIFDTDTATGDDTEETFYSGPLQLSYVNSACNAAKDTWEHTATTDGWSYNSTINVFETRFTLDWDEEHDLEVVDHDVEFGTYDSLLKELPDGVAVSSWESNVNSVFDCVDHGDEGALTFAVRIYDQDGNLADCAIWGHDPELITGGGWTAVNGSAASAFAACQNWNPA